MPIPVTTTLRVIALTPESRCYTLGLKASGAVPPGDTTPLPSESNVGADVGNCVADGLEILDFAVRNLHAPLVFASHHNFNH